jgi:hypothetical protein
MASGWAWVAKNDEIGSPEPFAPTQVWMQRKLDYLRLPGIRLDSDTGSGSAPDRSHGGRKVLNAGWGEM